MFCLVLEQNKPNRRKKREMQRMLRDKRAMHPLLSALVAFMIIMAAAGFLYVYVYLPLQTKPSEPVADVWAQGGFTVDLTEAETNAYTGASVSTTTPSYQAFHSNGKPLSSVTTLYGTTGSALSGTAIHFPMRKEDNGIIFVSCYTGTAHFPSIKSIRESNSDAYIDAKWLDVDTANLPRLVIALDLKKVIKPNLLGGGAVSAGSYEVKVRAVPEDDSVTMSDAADQSSITLTSGKETTIEWDITAITADAGAIIGKLYITSNQTALDIECFELSITRNLPIKESNPWASEISSFPVVNQFKTASGITQTWYYVQDDANLLRDGFLVGDPTGGNDGIAVTLRLKTYFSVTKHGVTVQLNIVVLDADGTPQTVVSASTTLTAA